MTRIINILGNSGTGKSFLSYNLAIALSNLGKQVILLDANIYSPDIANYSDIDHNVFLNEFLEGGRRIDETITHHPTGLKIIPSMPESTHDEKKHSLINDALLALKGKAEVIVVDSFSSSPAMHSTIHSADDNLFVLSDDFPNIIKAKEFISSLEKKQIHIIGTVINKARKTSDHKNTESILEKKILTSIPYDEKVIDSLNFRQPIYLRYPSSSLTKAISELAKLIDI